MIKLNGYWYTYQEVKEGLESKGYVISFYENEPDKRGNFTTDWYATKDGISKKLESAAIEEFHKKPKLI